MLDLNNVRFIGYSDAYFPNNRANPYQLRHILFMEDQTDSVLPIVFKYFESKHTTRSVITAEVIHLSDLLDSTMPLPEDLSNILGLVIPIELFTDSKIFLDGIWKGSLTTYGKVGSILQQLLGKVF